MKGAKRKIFRINRIVNSRQIFKTEAQKPHFVVKTDYFKAYFSPNDIFSQEIGFGPIKFNNSSINCVTASNNYMRGEFSSLQTFMRFKLTKTAKTILFLRPNEVDIQTTIPAYYGEVTNDVIFGKNPGMCACYNYNKMLWTGFVCQNIVSLFAFYQRPTFQSGFQFTLSPQYSIERVLAAFNFKEKLNNLGYRVIYTPKKPKFTHLFGFQYAEENYAATLEYETKVGPSIGLSFKPFKLLGLKYDIQTTMIIQKDKFKSLVNANLNDVVTLAVFTRQPFIGNPTVSVEVSLNFKTKKKDDQD
ncbi:hypothetical protein TVAG_342980 [Trichomonas vaginalis G3]|uniref:Uncharacterized protein n=1 Tax=Trichomonas vaginalis (strain ATCC PRA-98 / G3) TaxID=412133 RepID=A2EJR0_TRIV3|nr:hypothetical protein TVAGG3_0579810 [Trichomonas vaginalis G3]EAY07134.1 hypothetical protein TVAG_342980 [Trichomonas vaginalis G3]KAI5522489.1 hypothetical protein TVAGG3_0579810 [Trichomonas vaginalis G3]|eukprot:XP_001319357.1 hypothetical protein [Trichomonas vaginalis G3]